MLTKLYTYTTPVRADALDAFCELQRAYTDQFVVYDKGGAASPAEPARCLGLGRCVAVASLEEVEYVCQGPVEAAPVLFAFSRFDAANPAPADELMQSFPNVGLMVPELTLIERGGRTLLQVNSLGPVYAPRVGRFVRACEAARPRTRVSVPFELEPDSREEWEARVRAGLDAIARRRVEKVVLSRRQRLVAKAPFTSRDLVVNLVDGPARGCVVLYRYADVFFCGCTPALLVRRRADEVESMCLAGTCPTSSDEAERRRLAAELLADGKNRREHAYVVDFVSQVLRRNCYDVRIPETPRVMELPNVQHLHTPARARLLGGRTLMGLARELDPTPALSGAPVGEALMLIREAEGYSRGLFGGAAGCVTADGDGELRVALRTGVFDGHVGWVYAGCGIVVGSDATSEYDEIGMKLAAVLSAFDGGPGAPVAGGEARDGER